MEEIFKACDQLRSQVRNMNSCLICMPALVRLLYSTGLRIGEALALKNDDVDLKYNYLRVRDSKNGKERIIPISQSLASVCNEYVEYREQMPFRKTKERYFFIRANGNKCGSDVRNWFKKTLLKAKIPYKGRNHGPRIHDLRHTFAVSSLANMADSGIDLYVSLPILSGYLGHQSLKATNHYVRLTACMYPNLIKDVDTVCLDVFPKFKNYETN